jgi:peptidoglycan/LPS O-acetylase OafA/YrhL
LTQTNLLLAILLSPLNLLFLMGLLATSPRAMRCCNWVTSVNGLRLILFAMGFGLAIVWYLHESFALFTQSSVPWIRPLLYGVISVGILALAADRRVGSWFDDRMHKLIGDASYSIYLTHYHAIAATGIVLKKVGLLSFFHPVVQFFIMAAVGICSGIVFHYLVEKPLTRWLSQKWKRRAVPTLDA